jgi:hypothetical protein
MRTDEQGILLTSPNRSSFLVKITQGGWSPLRIAAWVALMAGMLLPVTGAAFSLLLAGIALVVGAVSTIRRAPASMDAAPAKSRSRYDSLHLLLFVAVAAIGLSPLWFNAGVPALNHDWGAFPVYREQLESWGLYTIKGWLPDGLGHPNAFPFNYPVQLAAWLFGQMFGPAAGIRLLLLAELTLAGIGARSLLVRLGAQSPAGIALAAVFYESSPIVLNKLAAGHWPYLLAYAVFPAIVVLADRVVSRARLADAAGLSFLTATAGSQGQFLLFTVAFVFVLALFKLRSLREGFALGAAMAAGFAMQLPGFYPLLAHVSTEYLSVERSTVFWERFQSVPPIEAFRLVGYIAHYADRTYKGIAAAIPGAIACASATAILMPRIRNARLFAALAVSAAVAALVEMGFDGPLAHLLAAGFSSNSAFTFIRELYNLSIFPALLATSGVAFLPEAFGLGGALVALMLAAGTTLTLSGFGAFIEYAGTSPGLQSAVDVISSSNSEGRVLWLPAPAPVGRDDTSGLDPMTVPIGRHASLQGNLATPVTGWVQAQILQGSITPATLRATGVEWVAVRHGLHSAVTNVEPSMKHALAAFKPQLLHGLTRLGTIAVDNRDVTLIHVDDVPPTLRFARRSQTAETWNTAELLNAAASGIALTAPDRAHAHGPKTQNIDPTKGPAPAAYWFWLTPELDDVPAFGRFALNNKLCVSHTARVLVDRVWAVRHSGCYSGSMVAVDPGSTATVNLALPQSRASSLHYRGGWMSDGYAGTYEADGAATLLDGSQYDKGWECVIDGRLTVAPALVNGYQMAFAVPGGRHDFRLQYKPGIVMRRLFLLAAALWAVCLIVFAYGRFSRSSTSS